MDNSKRLKGLGKAANWSSFSKTRLPNLKGIVPAKPPHPFNCFKNEKSSLSRSQAKAEWKDLSVEQKEAFKEKSKQLKTHYTSLFKLSLQVILTVETLSTLLEEHAAQKKVYLEMLPPPKETQKLRRFNKNKKKPEDN